MTDIKDYQSHGGRPTEDQLIDALARAFGAPEAAVIPWLQMVHVRFDARAANERLAARGG